jgi:predicted phosphodiesterase
MKLLCASDTHFRDDKPRCRTDNWIETQRTKLQWLIAQVNEHKCPLVIAGDIMHGGTNSQLLENLLLEEMKKAEYPILTISGNHDANYHSQKWLRKSTYWVLFQACAIQHMTGTMDFQESTISAFQFNEEMVDGTGIAVCHRSVYPTTEQIPFFMGKGTDTIGADDLLSNFNYELIVSGDIHMGFYLQQDGKTLINPGGISRQSAEKKYTNPMIYLYENGTVTPIEVPIVEDNVEQEYLINEKERDIRINASVERMGDSLLENGESLGLSFTDNIETALKVSETNDNVKLIIRKGVKGEL